MFERVQYHVFDIDVKLYLGAALAQLEQFEEWPKVKIQSRGTELFQTFFWTKNGTCAYYNVLFTQFWSFIFCENVTLKAKTEKTRGTNSLLQHSTPTVELQMPFFPTHIEQVKLRKFHRPPFNTNEIPTGIQIQINSCSKARF